MTLKITTIGYKLQFVGLIEGRVFNPRQQHVCSRAKRLAAAAGYKPAPQLGK